MKLNLLVLIITVFTFSNTIAQKSNEESLVNFDNRKQSKILIHC